MRPKVDPISAGEVQQTKLNVVRWFAVVFAVAALAMTYALWFGHWDICSPSSGWFVLVVVVLPLFLLACGVWLIFIAPSSIESVVWALVCSVVLLAYLPVVFITVAGSAMASASC